MDRPMMALANHHAIRARAPQLPSIHTRYYSIPRTSQLEACRKALDTTRLLETKQTSWPALMIFSRYIDLALSSLFSSLLYKC